MDTVNRTYRNIDIAIGQQADEVAQLASRISKLKLDGPLKHEDTLATPRLPDSVTGRPYNVTPAVAVTTAAALNAERSAHKLKRALLAARKEPLLNNNAATATPPPIAFKTPAKIPFGTSVPDPIFTTPIKGPLFSTSPQDQAPIPDWALPKDDKFDPSAGPPSLPAGRRGAMKKERMSGLLKKSWQNPMPGLISTSSSPPAGFSWGPLPTFNRGPATTMVDVATSKPMGVGESSTFSGWNVGLLRKQQQ